jgi:DNA-directed RNA polymerase subunit N (RpoN/RPB10)
MDDNSSTTFVRPVCPSCGNILGDKEESYKRLLYQGFTPGEAMDRLGVKDYCCRTRILRPAIVPKGYSLEDKQTESKIYNRNVKKDYRTPTNGILLALENFNGKDVITTLLPSEEFNRELLREYKIKSVPKILGAVERKDEDTYKDFFSIEEGVPGESERDVKSLPVIKNIKERR